MDLTVYPSKLYGTINAIPSKSQAHRLLICAAFSNAVTTLYCPQTNQDIEATVECLNALGAEICRVPHGYTVAPITNIPKKAILNCRESGSTLRFMLPIVGALGVESTFYLEGRLPYRPLSPMWEEMEKMGCHLCRPEEKTVKCTGKLSAGIYTIDGGVSSQYITGLLFAMALMEGSSSLNITGKLQSKPYVNMTQRALALFGVETDGYFVKGSFPFHSPGEIDIEGDWSNAAFFLAANKLSSDISIFGLEKDSPQGDRAVCQLLDKLETRCFISAADIPDLIPVLSVVAAAKSGAVFTDIQRLRLKESDRVASVATMLNNFGVSTNITDSTLEIFPGTFHGCTVNSFNDHRIAMSAAIAATVADCPVTILGADCVSKSYPTFWEEYQKLGGRYEQHIR